MLSGDLQAVVLVLEEVDRDRARFVPDAATGWAQAVLPREAWEELGAPLRLRMTLAPIA